jgi:hypothetical protein
VGTGRRHEAPAGSTISLPLQGMIGGGQDKAMGGRWALVKILKPRHYIRFSSVKLVCGADCHRYIYIYLLGRKARLAARLPA